ncbi:MAG: glycosyltransferase [Bacteroidetes bacterium]|nr:glycosyltransferase [Bacteroidota bacterium]
MPHVYIVILNYKKWEDSLACLESVLQLRYDDYTVIIIDNHSENNSVTELLLALKRRTVQSQNSTGRTVASVNAMPAYCIMEEEELSNKTAAVLPRLVFIKNKTNKGFAAGNNTVLRWLADEDAFIWLLNPDMLVQQNTLEELVHFATTASRKTITGAQVKFAEQPGKVHFYGGGKINFNTATIELIQERSRISEIDYISGGCFFTHIENFKQLGFLPEDYFLYWEETDFCYAARQQGYSLNVCEEAVCYDKVSTNIGKSFLSDYYYTRNGLFFLQKYKANKVAVAFFFSLFRLAKRILLFQFHRASGMFRGLLSFLNKEKHAYQ